MNSPNEFEVIVDLRIPHSSSYGLPVVHNGSGIISLTEQ